MSTTTNTAYNVRTDVVETETGLTTEEGALYTYNGELKAHLGGSTVVVKPKTTIVNISSAQILAMGTTPIELLPAPSANTYYDIEKILVEYIYNTTPYTFAVGNNCALVFGDVYRQIVLGKSTVNEVIRISDMQLYQQLSGSDIIHYNNYDGISALQLSTFLGTNPTLGDGTLRAIITYTVRTFGA